MDLNQILRTAQDMNLKPQSSEDYISRRVRFENSVEGELTGYDCDVCKNRGYSALNVDGNVIFRECKCAETRRSLQAIEKSGLKDVVDKLTFDSFIAAEPWQDTMKRIAMDFVNQSDKWLFVGGQIGAGKSHICTAAAGALMRKGLSARYMRWRDDSVRLKSFATNGEEYQATIQPFKTAKVLYIDDFFKSDGIPTSADINIAFELLNHRYINDGITIISSEKSLGDIIKIDEAVGSRIYQRSAGYQIEISNDKSKNYRMK